MVERRKTAAPYVVALAAWLPFFAIWAVFAATYGGASVAAALLISAISMGSAALLGVGVWHLCRRRPWPLTLAIGFYVRQIVLAVAYAVVWSLVVNAAESLRRGENAFAETLRSPLLGWQLLIGVWLYGLFAGVSYAVQTRQRLHEQAALAARAEAAAAAARLDAIRARLNPHFLFNALHTLGALARLQPSAVEEAIERLGDMLRYTLREDGRALVEFDKEWRFTEHYLEFERLRFGARLRIETRVAPECRDCDLPPFALQTLAENAVRHAIDVRPEGGAIAIVCERDAGRLHIVVRDDGPGDGKGASTRYGLRALRERLTAAYGSDAELHAGPTAEGYEARLILPAGESDAAGASPRGAAR